MNKIALLNDNFRVTFVGGQVVMTAGVADLPMDVKARALIQVQRLCGLQCGQRPPWGARLRQFRTRRRKVSL
jgi:hypothetical protein